MVDVATLQIRVDTADLARGEASLEALQREGRQTETTFNRLGTTATRTGGAVRRVGGSAGAAGRQFQNAAFQVGDFATQVASGQRASVALAQQLPQLLGGFGVLGAVLGAVVAIGGALVPLFFSIGDEAEDAASRTDNLEDSLRALKKALEDQRGPIDELIEKWGEYDAIIDAVLTRQTQRATEDFSKAIDEQIASLGELDDSVNSLGAVVQIFELAAEGGRIATEQVKNLPPALVEVANAYFQLRDAADVSAQIAAADRLQSAITNAGGSYDFSGVQAVLDDLILKLREAETAADDTSAAVASVGRGDPRDFTNLDEFRKQLREQEEWAKRDEERKAREARVGTRGGGSRVDTFARDLERLQKSLRTEREFVDAWYAESQAILAERKAMEILGEQEHREALLRVEQEYQSRLRDIRLSEQDKTLGYTASFFGAMAQATEAGGARLAKAAAVFGAVEATVNAYRAAAQALADPSVPFWGKAAAYASVLATGFQAVAAIRSAGGGGGGGAAPSAPSAPNYSQAVAITLEGSETATFTKSQVRDLINQINEAVEGGAIVRLA